uniref:Uncharacterized protein n=1 Tax=Spodoptera frugiperda nuclear polyhedrosis virus TaxID=10455 RepID=A0A7G3W7P8_NPVSF|nr:hypothetical protein [Spodoptera frugiperda multiple nucleopolyhedrovirus]
MLSRERIDSLLCRQLLRRELTGGFNIRKKVQVSIAANRIAKWLKFKTDLKHVNDSVLYYFELIIYRKKPEPVYCFLFYKNEISKLCHFNSQPPKPGSEGRVL